MGNEFLKDILRKRRQLRINYAKLTGDQTFLIFTQHKAKRLVSKVLVTLTAVFVGAVKRHGTSYTKIVCRSSYMFYAS